MWPAHANTYTYERVHVHVLARARTRVWGAGFSRVISTRPRNGIRTRGLVHCLRPTTRRHVRQCVRMLINRMIVKNVL